MPDVSRQYPQLVHDVSIEDLLHDKDAEIAALRRVLFQWQLRAWGHFVVNWLAIVAILKLLGLISVRF